MTTDEFSAFYARWYPDMVRYMAWKVLGGQQDAEDLAQDIFTSLYKNVTGLRPDTADRYLWVAARHIALAANRVNHRAPLTVDMQPDPTVVTPSLMLMRYVERRMACPPEDQAIVDNDRIQERLACLRDREREIITANVLNAIPLAELAENAGRSEERMRQIRRRGLERLKDDWLQACG